MTLAHLADANVQDTGRVAFFRRFPSRLSTRALVLLVYRAGRYGITTLGDAIR